MKRVFLVILTVWLLGTGGAVVANSVSVTSEIPTGNAYIPQGTLIEAELITGVRSDENNIHDIAYFKTKQNVIVNGVIVLPAGTVGNAQVTAAKPAGFFGQQGRIELKATSIQALNGALIPLTLDIKKYSGRDDRNMIYFILALYDAGYQKLAKLAAAYQGDDKEIPAGTKFQVAVDTDADLGCTPDRLEVLMVKRP